MSSSKESYLFLIFPLADSVEEHLLSVFVLLKYWKIIIISSSCVLFLNIYLFIWLHWVLVVACGIFVAARGLLSGCGAWALERAGLVAPWHVGFESPDQGSKLRPLHWKADS